MPKETRKTAKTRVARLSPADQADLWRLVRGVIGTPAPLASSADFWDPERETWFRPAKLVRMPEAGRLATEALIKWYGDVVKQEAKVAKAPPSSILNKFERIRNDLLKAAGTLENLSQVELRVAVQVAPDGLHGLIKEITPLSWPGPDSNSKLTKLLRQRAGEIDVLIAAMAQRRPGTAWGPVGRGNTILSHLEIGPSAWQLVHITWRILEDFGRPRPPALKVAELLEFLSYVHELATGERDADFGSEVARYIAMRPEFDSLVRSLQTATLKFRLENFFQLQEHVDRRINRGTPPTTITILKQAIDRYVVLRSQLTVGPSPVRRTRKPLESF